jgi:hypothetical protein
MKAANILIGFSIFVALSAASAKDVIYLPPQQVPAEVHNQGAGSMVVRQPPVEQQEQKGLLSTLRSAAMNTGMQAYVFCCGGANDDYVISAQNRVPFDTDVLIANKVANGQLVSREKLKEMQQYIETSRPQGFLETLQSRR